MNNYYPVFVKTYNLTLWYIQKLNSLPKNHRYTLGEKIQNTLLNLLLILTRKCDFSLTSISSYQGETKVTLPNEEKF